MDLIDRKAAIEACLEVSKQEEEHSKIWAAGLRYAKKILVELPTVPAVPLEKLCERLGNFSECPSCAECKLYGIKCGEYGACGSKEHWKAVLSKWMEE